MASRIRSSVVFDGHAVFPLPGLICKAGGIMFHPDDYVVHRNSGLCRVVGTGFPQFGGMTSAEECYILEQQRSHGTVYTPLDGADTVLRPVMSRDEAELLVVRIPEIEIIYEDNEKIREAAYRKALHEEGYVGWVRVIKTAIAKRAARLKMGKKSTIVDRKYEKMAQDYLYEELALVYDIPKDAVEPFLRDRCSAAFEN